MSNPKSASARRNLLLSLLSDTEFEEISPHLEIIPMALKDSVFDRDKPVSHVHFPLTCVLSILSNMEDGSAVEVGTVGREGFSGVDVLIGGNIATANCLCQISGESCRMPAQAFRHAIEGNSQLRQVSQQYTQAYVSQISQTIACNRLHTTEERFARWVLMTHDRIDGNEFYLTQEFLADMLGVHRPTVSLVARTFQQAGIIQYSRGKMIVLNRSLLEDASCECYGAVARQFKRLLGVKMG